MKRLRRISIVLFMISVIVFGVFWYREKIKKDQTGPVFHVDNGALMISVKDDDTSLLNGITASDVKDGDVTSAVTPKPRAMPRVSVVLPTPTSPSNSIITGALSVRPRFSPYLSISVSEWTNMNIFYHILEIYLWLTQVNPSSATLRNKKETSLRLSC